MKKTQNVQHIMCCVFVLFLRRVCPMLPVSLDCPLLIVPSVFSNAYFQKSLYDTCSEENK